MKLRIASFVSAMVATTFTGAMVAAPVVLTAKPAQAQKGTVNTGDLLAGLVNLNLALVEAGVNIGDITLEDVVDIGDIDVANLINVHSVLNKNDIDILNDSLNDNEVLNDLTIDLTNVLRDADILNKNQVVVGILSGQFVVQNIRSAGAR